MVVSASATSASVAAVGVQLRICEEVGVSMHGKILKSALVRKHERRNSKRLNNNSHVPKGVGQLRL